MSSVVVIGEWTIDYYGIPWWNSFPPMCSPPENCIETRCVARWVTRGGACTVWVSRGGAYIVWVTRGGAFTVWVTRGGAYTVWVTRGGAYTVWVTRGGLYTKKNCIYVKLIWQEMKQENFNWQEARKKNQVRVTGFKPKTFVENRVKHIQFDYHDGENMNLFPLL